MHQAVGSGGDATLLQAAGYGVVLADAGLNLQRCFADFSGTVVVAASDPQSLTLYSRYAREKRAIASAKEDPQQAVADLVSLSWRFREPPMLAFDNEAVLLLVSRHREVLSKHYRFLLPSAELVEDVCCKLRFAALAQKLDLLVPASLVPGPEDSAETIAQRVGLPCVLKPTSHLGRFHLEMLQHEGGHGQKVLRADTLESLRGKLAWMRTHDHRFVVQQYVPGDDGCLYSFHAYLDEEAYPLGFFVGRKIRTAPRDSGFSAYLELVHDPQVEAMGFEAVKKMGLVGAVKLDFKKDLVQNRCYLLECNARFTLWNYLGAANGVNLPRLALGSLYGDETLPQTYATGVKWHSFALDLRAFLREYRPAGEWDWPHWLWSLRGQKVHDVFSWRDPWPAVVCAGRYGIANWHKVTGYAARCLHALRPPVAAVPVGSVGPATPAGALPGESQAQTAKERPAA